MGGITPTRVDGVDGIIAEDDVDDEDGWVGNMALLCFAFTAAYSVGVRKWNGKRWRVGIAAANAERTAHATTLLAQWWCLSWHGTSICWLVVYKKTATTTTLK
jgi:hypothetical protein